MGLASILVALLASTFIVAGVLTSTVPVVGFLLAFAAPALALTGIVLGGTALSRAKATGLRGGVGMAGVVLNGLAFAPALATALTCGMCNACISVAGDGETDLDLFVYDAAGALICQDTDGGDDCVVVFQPQATGPVTVKVTNHGALENEYTVIAR